MRNQKRDRQAAKNPETEESEACHGEKFAGNLGQVAVEKKLARDEQIDCGRGGCEKAGKTEGLIREKRLWKRK